MAETSDSSSERTGDAARRAKAGGHAHGTAGAVGGTALAVGALGVVFGDIGTSPLYAFRETFEHHHIPVVPDNVLGAASLALWSMVLIVTLKYVYFILRADNHGEGGILALTTLVVGSEGAKGRRMFVLLMMGLFGMSLLYGDGVITPAISVLSATEGLRVAAPALESWVIPLAVTILFGLFALQRRGTGAVGQLFGPVMLVWFSVLGLLGLGRALGNLEVLEAVNPLLAIDYLTSNGIDGFLSLGSIFLVVTGAEALYADLGHFGRRPIRTAWLGVAMPGLVLNYFGQAALLLDEPEAITSPFFLMGPQWARWPLVILATFATVIASQALISGVFSLTVQAMQLDYLPRLTVRHTSESHVGQVYLPMANLALMIGCIGLVLTFRSSSNLAAAYGLAVTTTMIVTTFLFYALATRTWHWSQPKALALCIPLGALELGFFGANLFKIPKGGWFPLVLGTGIMISITTWRTGRRAVAERLAVGRVPVAKFLEEGAPGLTRVPGTAVYMFRGDGVVPPSLLTNTRHNRALHERVILLSVVTTTKPYEDPADKVEITDFASGMHQVVLRHGFMEEPDVPRAIDGLVIGGEPVHADEVTFFLGRETVIPSNIVTMKPWRERLFALMLRSAASASRFFRLPPNQVVEVGSQVEI